MRTTGPVLAIGGITLFNKSVIHGEPIDWRIPVATGLVAAGFALLEKAWADGAVALAWVALVALLLTRIDGTPSPIESVRDLLLERR